MPRKNQPASEPDDGIRRIVHLGPDGKAAWPNKITAPNGTEMEGFGDPDNPGRPDQHRR